MASANDIRRTFLEFFRDNGHEVLASSPLVPHNDPTLLFTNAGMVQFKNVFTGAEHRHYARAATSQKCVRAGGKHNDLDNVGYTARHHTFFEMLGNFSFGDYFKERAIELAWTLITKEYGLPADRLLVTVYAEDEDAAGLWRRIAGLPEDRIIRIATSDNFWQMGDTGPCGPCSEIFFDHGPGIPGGPPGSPDEDGDRFIEIWNLVFMQFEQFAGGERVALPRPSIDTGMGLERISAVLQGKHDNYDIDLLRRIIEASAHLTGTDPDGPHAASHKVVADHLRAVSFLIADGVTPSNEGRGYVMRRILRRAVRHAHMMGCRDPLLWRLFPVLKQTMGQAFPELDRAEALITETLKLEETRFRETLERGLRLLEEEKGRLGEREALPGEVAFRLYDTFGFPLDLTQDVLRAEGRGVDTAGFEQAMERQRAQARAAWAGSGDQATARVWWEVRDLAGATEFLGHATLDAEAKVVALLRDGVQVQSLEPGESGAVLVNQTPFYAESGGQMADVGVIVGGDARFEVTDVRREAGDLHVHLGQLSGAALEVGRTVHLTVTGTRRDRLRANHSATHLLHAALRRHLGDHVSQKGSLVAPERLRFDISHPKPITPEEMLAVEADVNRQVRANVPVTTRLMTPEEAVAAGALALFGERYGDEVRVVAMGAEEGGHFSMELCGGTHVARTGDIGAFRIVQEAAVAAGVRRIEAVTGEAVLELSHQQENTLKQAAGLLRAAPGELVERVQALVEDRRRLERELADLRRRLASGDGAGAAAVSDVNGVRYSGRRLDDVPARELRGMVDAARKELGSGVVAIVAVADGKVALTVGVSDDLVGRLDAVALVRAGAAAVGGKGGGGRPDMAQAGGPDVDNADAALAAIAAAIEASTRAA